MTRQKEVLDALATLAPILRLAHALAGILLVGGLLGRWVALADAQKAARASDLPGAQALLGASSVFERIVIPSWSVVLLLGLLAAWSAGYPLLGFLQGGPNWLLVSLVLYLSTLPLVPLIFLPKGRAFGAALNDALGQGRATPALVAAFADPLARAAHVYEAVAIVIVLVLMIAKPF